MFLAEKMDRTSFLVLKKDIDSVLEEIATVGLLHPACVEDLDAWAGELASLDVAGVSERYLTMRQRAIHLLGESSAERRLQAVSGTQTVTFGSPAEIDETLIRLEAILLPLLSSRDSLDGKLNDLRAIQARNESLLASEFPFSQLGQSAYLTSVAGVIEETQLGRLEGLLGSAPSLVVPFGKEKTELRVLCVALRKDRELLDSALKAVSFRELAGMDEFPKMTGRSGLQDEIRALEQERENIVQRINSVRDVATPELASLLEEVESALLVLRLRTVCKTTAQSCLISGWTPRSNTRTLVDAVTAKTRGQVVVQVTPAEELDKVNEGTVSVPVLFRHAAFLQPFELFVETYGIPSYRAVDPTAFASLAFLVMFGMMFGDLGHGMVLLVAGLILNFSYPALRNIGKLLVYSGVSASLFGLLFGSVFGIETLFPALWVKPFEGIDSIFKAAIIFGVIVLSGGVLINTINAIRTHSFGAHFFEIAGPLGGIIYWIGVVMVAKLVYSSMNPSSLGIESLLFGGLLLVFFFKGPLERIIRGKGRFFPGGVLTYLIENTVEVLELLMGYLANTVSFIRVAAFELAHAGLLVAVFGISDIVSQWPAGTLASALVLVVGNAIVIVFEGAVVTIQILRLEYYEFFGKFFKEFGVKYDPVGHAGPLVHSRN